MRPTRHASSQPANSDLQFWPRGSTTLVQAGHRVCPDPTCRLHLFVAFEPGGRLLVTYPAEVIDFDATKLPPKVLSAFDEAIRCHSAGCYPAACLMVRKALRLSARSAERAART